MRRRESIGGNRPQPSLPWQAPNIHVHVEFQQ